MGIQDRDYWNEWQRQKEGLPPREQGTPATGRRFRLIDKVRVRPSHHEVERVRVEKKGTLVGPLLIVFLSFALGWTIRLIYRLMQ